MKIRWLFCLGLLWVRGALAGEQAVTPEAQTPPQKVGSAGVVTNAQDYSQGFRTFARMGLPDTSKARYVTLSGNGFAGGMGYYALSEVRLSGNAWLITENPEGKSVLVSSSGEVLELFDRKTVLKKLQAETVKENGKPSGKTIRLGDSDEFRQSGTWASADLSRDLAKAASSLDKKIKEKAENPSSARYDSLIQTDEGIGSLFLLAAFAWQNGHVQEANAIAGKLFALLGDSRKVVVSALNVMVDAQLSAATDAFRKAHDWTAYHNALAGLLKRFPSGWRKAGGVKILDDRLQARIALTTPPAVTGDGLGEEDNKLAADLLSETDTSGCFGYADPVWIFPQINSGNARAPAGTNVIARIQSRGLQSVPLLIALASDETLCLACRNRFGASHFFSSSDSSESAEERNLAVYNELDRPLTRGEIARQLLEPLLGSGDDDAHADSTQSTEEQIEAAKRLYQNLKATPPGELPQFFLKNGNSEQRSAAVRYLLNGNVETNAAQIEAVLLAPPTESSGYASIASGENPLVRAYVEARGEKAAEFVEKYAAARKNAGVPESMADNEEFVKMAEKSSERELKVLRALVKKQDASEPFAALANADSDGDSERLVYLALKKMPAEKSIPLLLARAVEATNALARARVLRTLPMVRYAAMDGGNGVGELASAASEEDAMRQLAEKTKSTIGTNAPTWKVLLADERAVPASRRMRYAEDGPGETVADLAAAAIEALYGTEVDRYQQPVTYELQQLRPKAAQTLIRSRATARLEGTAEEQLPKAPSADDVADDRRKTLEQAIINASTDELDGLMNKLTDAEILYVIEALEQNEALKNAFTNLKRRIATVSIDPAFQASDASKLKQFVGKPVCADVVTQMQSVCKSQLASGKSSLICLTSSGPIGGLKLSASGMDSESQRAYLRGSQSQLRKLNTGKGRFGLLMGMLNSEDGYHHANWAIELPPDAASGATDPKRDDSQTDDEKSIAESFEDSQRDFAEAITTFFAEQDSLRGMIGVTFLGALPTTEAGKKEAKDDNDPFEVE